MDRAFAMQRRLITGGLALLLVADLGLAIYSWQTSSALRTPMAQLQADSTKLGELKKGIEAAETTRHNLPTTVETCDRFEAAFLPASTGNSTIDAELDDLAKKSGVQVQSVTLRHKEVPARGLTQVDLDSAVSGEYANIVKFMNSLQRSRNFYVVESLNLQAEGQGGPTTLRIGLHLKTYFRTNA